VPTITALPELRNFGMCRSCGQRIGWVTIKPGTGRRPVDPEPRPHAEYALLRNGVTAVNLRDPGVDQQFESYEGPRFWDHRKTCPVPSLSTARAAIGQLLGYVEDVYEHDGRPTRPHEDQAREARRRNLLAADQSSSVGRRDRTG
jgi:CRISPR-associated Cas5-like protein